ncbi:MAG: hypothetical protein WA988_17395, partial [Candidatus Nanopelagicales bacterium]
QNRNDSRSALIAAELAHTRALDNQARLDKAIAALTGHNPAAAACPTCQQTLTDTTGLISDLRAQADTAATEVVNATAAFTAARDVDARSEQLVSQARNDLAQVDALANRLEHARDTAALADRRHHEAAALLAAVVDGITGKSSPTDPAGARSAALEAHGVITRDLETARQLVHAWKGVQAANDRVASSAARLDSCRQAVLPSPMAAELSSAVAAADRAREEFEKAQAAAADADAGARAAQVTALQLADIADDAATRWSLKQDAADAAEESRIARDLVIALRRDLLGEYCDTISAAATEVMLRLGGEHLGFVLDSAFVPQVVLPDGSTRATRQLSGGEKARAAVCAFIGISRQLSGGGTPGMIIADEITAAQDETFRREMLTMLRSLEMPLIVVSHTADVLDIASNVIRLHRPPLGSTSIAA